MAWGMEIDRWKITRILRGNHGPIVKIHASALACLPEYKNEGGSATRFSFTISNTYQEQSPTVWLPAL